MRTFLRVLVVALTALIAGVITGTTSVGAASFTYDAATAERVDVNEIDGAVARPPLFSDVRERSALPSDEGRGASTTPSARSVATKVGPVNELEVGKYGDLAKRSVGDGLTPDHIPSNAARRAAIERELGRELSPSEARALRDEGNCMVVSTCAHQQVSRTFGGRNTQAQIESDAADLGGGAAQDLAVWRRYLISAGYSPAKVDAAIAQLNARNVADGVHP
jgi:hypothetical protein